MDKRITDIEIQLMHQENTIQQLNEVVVKQHQMIEKLNADLTAMMEHIKAITPSALEETEEEEPPPHY
jgi:uncharacterized coiled-coil protein SlyX